MIGEGWECDHCHMKVVIPGDMFLNNVVRNGSVERSAPEGWVQVAGLGVERWDVKHFHNRECTMRYINDLLLNELHKGDL